MEQTLDKTEVKPKKINLEINYLQQLQKANTPVSIYLKNGVQIRGWIDTFNDDYLVILSESNMLTVYKHAIATIMPTLDAQLIKTELNNEKQKSSQQQISRTRHPYRSYTKGS